jgi:hypothetical protein
MQTNNADNDRSIVRKDLRDADGIDGDGREHYSPEGVAEACHAEEGQAHE